MLPTGLVLLGAAVVVERENGASRCPRSGAQPDRGLATVGAYLQGRPVAEVGQRRAVQEIALVLGHEPLGSTGVLQEVGRHLTHAWERNDSVSWHDYLEHVLVSKGPPDRTEGPCRSRSARTSE